MRTSYLGHDQEYRRRRDAGQLGWDTPSQELENVAIFEEALLLADLGIQGNNRRLVEFGCGAGNNLIDLAQKGWQVSGIDISPFAIEWAREKVTALGIAADLLVADLTHELPWEQPPADVVLDGHCLHCIITDDRVTFLRNVRNVLKPGGIFIIHSMCGDPHLPIGKCAFDSRTRCLMHKDIALRYFGEPDSILAELAAAGFTVLNSKLTLARDQDDQDCLMVVASSDC